MNNREFIESKRTDGLFTKTDLMDLNKIQQVMILKEDIGLTDKDLDLLKNESVRVKKILQLQKKVVAENKVKQEETLKVVKGEICSRCNSVMKLTGGGPSGHDYHCDKCGLNTTK